MRAWPTHLDQANAVRHLALIPGPINRDPVGFACCAEVHANQLNSPCTRVDGGINTPSKSRKSHAGPGSDRGDELDVLATLIEAFEKKHFPIEPADPVEAIVFRMEQAGLERKDLEPLIGSRARVSEVLNRKRDLSLAMIRRLHDELHIPYENLIKKSA